MDEVIYVTTPERTAVRHCHVSHLTFSPLTDIHPSRKARLTLSNEQSVDLNAKKKDPHYPIWAWPHSAEGLCWWTMDNNLILHLFVQYYRGWGWGWGGYFRGFFLSPFSLTSLQLQRGEMMARFRARGISCWPASHAGRENHHTSHHTVIVKQSDQADTKCCQQLRDYDVNSTQQFKWGLQIFSEHSHHLRLQCVIPFWDLPWPACKSEGPTQPTTTTQLQSHHACSILTSAPLRWKPPWKRDDLLS